MELNNKKKNKNKKKGMGMGREREQGKQPEGINAGEGKNMENTELEKNKKEMKTEEIVKITVSKEAEEKLMAVIEKVNNGFDAGKVNRQDLASWVLIRFAKECGLETIKEIRQDHFDEFAVLESILKRSKEQGQLPQELKDLVRGQLNSFTAPRRAGKKPLTKNYINDAIESGQETDKKD